MRLFAIICFLTSSTLHARFQLLDANEIDREDRLSTETFADYLSYRYPYNYLKEWEKKRLGLLVSAGSLDAKRFHYLEHIKLKTDPMESASFSFDQRRDESKIESTHEQEIRLSLRPFESSLQLSMMGDGGTFKSYGDVGFAASYYPNQFARTELFFWSVDHYYNEKKDEENDKRTRETWSAGIDQDILSSFGRWQLRYEYDHPLTWYRSNERYQYSRKTVQAAYTLPDPKTYELTFRTAFDHKEESKYWNHVSEMKIMERDMATQEVELVLLDDKDWHQFILQRIERNTAYEYGKVITQEQHSPSTRRREIGFVYARNIAVGSTQKNRFQYGGNINPMEIIENGEVTKAKDIKLQTAFDFFVATQARLFLNMTWDLDQIAADYPYKDDPAKPWGGGNIQLIAVF